MYFISGHPQARIGSSPKPASGAETSPPLYPVHPVHPCKKIRIDRLRHCRLIPVGRDIRDRGPDVRISTRGVILTIPAIGPDSGVDLS